MVMDTVGWECCIYMVWELNRYVWTVCNCVLVQVLIMNTLQSYTKALQFFQQAVDKGSAEGQYYFGYMSYSMWPVD